MIGVLRQPTYRRLFGAQVIALAGTGLATVALGLLAYDLAAERAGLVLGTALTIKMLAYVLLAPVAGAVAERVDRRTWLIGLDLVRAVAALSLPFVSEIWQIYALIFLLQAASAGFTPAFQATIPEILPDEDDYTEALSLSRMAQDIESLASPVLAALLLALMPFGALFFGTALGFAVSALLISALTLPRPLPRGAQSLAARSVHGLRVYLATPLLRGLLALSFCAAMAGSMVFVNTVVIVRAALGLNDQAVALMLGFFGAGSLLSALCVPALLRRWAEQRVMQAGGFLCGLALPALAVWIAGAAGGPVSLAIAWFAVGLGYSLVLTPSGRLLRRSSDSADRPSLFAAHFTLTHLCWLLSYPLAGWLTAGYGTIPALSVLGVLGLSGVAVAHWLWPRPEADHIARAQ